MSKSYAKKLMIFAVLLGTVGCGGSKKEDSDTPTPYNTDEGADSEGFLFTAGQSIQSKNKKFQMKILWLDGPTVGEPSTVEILIGDKERKAPTTVEELEFLPFMTIHGHPGALRRMEIEQDDELLYKYKATGFYLTMSGPWDLIVNATVNGNRDEAVYSFDVE
jgi:hypothetical protein